MKKNDLPPNIIDAIAAIDKYISLDEFKYTIESLKKALQNLESTTYALDSYVNKKDFQWSASREQSLNHGIDAYIEATSKYVSFNSKVSYEFVYEELEKQKQHVLDSKPIYDIVQHLIDLKNIPSTGLCIIPHRAFRYPVEDIYRLWVAYPEFKYGDVPEHRRNAFLEDKGHDWNLSGRGISYSGILRNYGEDSRGNGRILVEYKVERKTKK